MKALLLSGGKGTRLRPITYTSSKQLIPIANKPVLFYGIEQIVRVGIKDVGIIVGDSKKEIKEVVGNGKRWGIKITYIHQKEPLGIAHAVKIAKDYLNNDDFILYLGDNLLHEDLKGFVNDFKKKKLDCKILLTEVKHPELFGVAKFKNKKVVKLVEKPKDPPSHFALCGIYLFNKEIFPIIDKLNPSNRGEYEITEAIQNLIDAKFKVGHSFVTGWWKDTGKLEDLLEANRIILDRNIKNETQSNIKKDTSIQGRVKIGKNCIISNSIIRGPVIIGDNTLIKDCYIGPYTSINNGCSLNGCEVEYSIILENGKLENIRGRVDHSLLGKNVEIKSVKKMSSSISLMVGDNSKIILGGRDD